MTDLVLQIPRLNWPLRLDHSSLPWHDYDAGGVALSGSNVTWPLPTNSHSAPRGPQPHITHHNTGFVVIPTNEVS